MSSHPGIRPPCKRSMVRDEHTRDCQRRCLFQASNNGVARVVLVFLSNLLIGHFGSYPHRTMAVIRMSSTEAWDRPAGLGPRGGILGVGVGDASDFRKLVVQHKMCWQIRRRPQLSFP